MAATIADYEVRFRRAGLPLLIEDRSASEDVWTRVAGLLVLVFAVEALGAVDLQWTWWQNLLAVGGAAVALTGAWIASNRLRGRPLRARPQDIGRAELVGFVALPALLPLIFNGQTTSALVTAAGNTALLALLYGAAAYGLLSIVRWAGERLLGQLARSVLLLARALPLLMLFSVVLLFTTEMWQVFSDLPDHALIEVAGLQVAIGSLFLIVRIPREVQAIEDAVHAGPPLDRRQRLNVGLVMFVSQALQVLVVTLAIGLFFVAFGALAITDEVIKEWTGHAAPENLLTVFGLSVSVELIHVSAAIAALSGLYYAIATLTDATYREEFLAEVTEEMRATFLARVEYLALRTGQA